MQDEVGLESALRLVVVRNHQLVLSEPTADFVRSVEFGADGIAARIHPTPHAERVFIDPLRGFGEPTVRNVRTEIIAEQMRAGEPVSVIADLYDLSEADVEDALRYQLIRASAQEVDAA